MQSDFFHIPSILYEVTKRPGEQPALRLCEALLDSSAIFCAIEFIQHGPSKQGEEVVQTSFWIPTHLSPL